MARRSILLLVPIGLGLFGSTGRSLAAEPEPTRPTRGRQMTNGHTAIRAEASGAPLCRDRPGVDRAQVHGRLREVIAESFDRHLRPVL
jgi:hypothetical protein